MVRTQGWTNRGYASIGADADSMHALSSGSPVKSKAAKLTETDLSEVEGSQKGT
jgi:hypothetical protein